MCSTHEACIVEFGALVQTAKRTWGVHNLCHQKLIVLRLN